MTVHAAPPARPGYVRRLRGDGALPGREGGGTGRIRVLVVEDSAALAEERVRELRRQGYAVSLAASGVRALDLYEQADLVLLALELPDIDGLEVCRQIREAEHKPIISLTARDTELDRVLALQAGADDCVVATCGLREIMARIEAVLRRVYPPSDREPVLSVGALRIDGRTREVRLRDRPVEVTAKEFELLSTLAANAESVVSRKELMARVWGVKWGESSRTIDTHIRSLRAKLGSHAWIITVRGVGYRMGHG